MVFDKPAAPARPAPLAGIASAPLAQLRPQAAPSADPPGAGPAALVFDSPAAVRPSASADSGGWFGGDNPAAAFVHVPATTIAPPAPDPTAGLGFLANPAAEAAAPPRPSPETADDAAAWPEPAIASPDGFHLNQWGTSAAPASPANGGGGTGLGLPSASPGHAGDRGWGVRDQAAPTPPSWNVGPGGVPASGGAVAYSPTAPPVLLPATWPEHPPSPVAQRSHTLIPLLLVIIVAAAGAFAYLRYFKGSASTTHTISMPASIGGVPLSSDATLVAAATKMQSQAGQAAGVTQSVAGFYGDQGGGVPKFAIVAVAANRTVTAADADQFVHGLNSGSPGSFDAASATTQSDSTVDYTCGALTQGGSLCYWRDGNVFGAVIGFAGVDASGTVAEAEAARVALEH